MTGRERNLKLHVGIIPDGTRRWCARNFVSLERGYFRAMELLAEVVDRLLARGATSVSIYLLSQENLQRPASDLAAVYSAESWFLREAIRPVLAERLASVVIAGELARLPDQIRAAAHDLLASASHVDSVRRVYLCLAYSPLAEIRDAIRSGRVSAESTDLDLITGLWVPESVDLLIRTGGKARISNFLSLQSGYAELFLADELFNDFTLDRVDAAVEWFRTADRGFGE